MKLLLSLFLVFCFGLSCSAQKVFSVQYANQADVKVFVVDYENQADLKVYKVNYANQAGKNNGKWFFTKYANQADKKVFYVDRKSTRLNSSHVRISYAVFCLKKKKKKRT